MDDASASIFSRSLLEKVSNNLEILSVMMLLIEANISKGMRMTIEPVSDAIYSLLMSAGIERGRLAGREAHGMKGPALSAMASSGGVKASNPEGGPGYSPIGRQGGERPMGNSGKDRGNVAPAKFTVLTCKAPNAHGRRKKAPGTYLRLVWSR